MASSHVPHDAQTAATSSAVSPESLHAWLGLPSSIRRDVSMASLRSVYEPNADESAVETSFGGSATSSNDGDRSEFEFGATQPVNATTDEKCEEDVTGKQQDETQPDFQHHQHSKWVKNTTTFVLCAVWLACVAIMAQHSGKQLTVRTLAVPRHGEKGEEFSWLFFTLHFSIN